MSYYTHYIVKSQVVAKVFFGFGRKSLCGKHLGLAYVGLDAAGHLGF
jgi:hypothetical protein